MGIFLLPLFAAAFAAGSGRFISHRAAADFALTADLNAPRWKNIRGVFADENNFAVKQPHRTEIRSRWTRDNLYFLFICPYDELFLNPNPSTATETNKLWEHDVAEVFIGEDFENIHQYKEFQVSPQGEWVDLDIDTKKPKPEGGWRWNSGFKVQARIDSAAKVWYGEMQIPFQAIGPRPAKRGLEFRIDLFRFHGPGPNREMVAWQPTGRANNHTPEKFGILVLE